MRLANRISRYQHPYDAEIRDLEYPKTVLQAKEPIKYQPVETTTATFVDTFEGVLDMLEELKTATEIAIDTEHHDFRTYTGLLSLMQISTREKDWIVDTLQPWRRKLEVLNEVFADPKIVKVSTVRTNHLLSIARITNSHRYFMAPIWISSGYNEIAVFILSDCSTHSRQPWRYNILAEVSPTYSKSSLISTQIRSTSWLIGEYGMTTSP